jgi:hypothetical protein
MQRIRKITSTEGNKPVGYINPTTGIITVKSTDGSLPILVKLVIRHPDQHTIYFVSTDPTYYQKLWFQQIVDVVYDKPDSISTMMQCLIDRTPGSFVYNKNRYEYKKYSDNDVLVLISSLSIAPPLMPASEIINGNWKLPFTSNLVKNYWLPVQHFLISKWEQPVLRIDRFINENSHEIYATAKVDNPFMFECEGWSCVCEKSDDHLLNVTITPSDEDVTWCRIVTYTSQDNEKQIFTYGACYGRAADQYKITIDGKEYDYSLFNDVCITTTVSNAQTVKIFQDFWNSNQGKLDFDEQEDGRVITDIVDGFVCTYTPDPHNSYFTIRHQ